jgi:hypothetical protein
MQAGSTPPPSSPIFPSSAHGTPASLPAFRPSSHARTWGPATAAVAQRWVAGLLRTCDQTEGGAAAPPPTAVHGKSRGGPQLLPPPLGEAPGTVQEAVPHQLIRPAIATVSPFVRAVPSSQAQPAMESNSRPSGPLPEFFHVASGAFHRTQPGLRTKPAASILPRDEGALAWLACRMVPGRDGVTTNVLSALGRCRPCLLTRPRAVVNHPLVLQATDHATEHHNHRPRQPVPRSEFVRPANRNGSGISQHATRDPGTFENARQDRWVGHLTTGKNPSFGFSTKDGWDSTLRLLQKTAPAVTHPGALSASDRDSFTPTPKRRSFLSSRRDAAIVHGCAGGRVRRPFPPSSTRLSSMLIRVLGCIGP